LRTWPPIAWQVDLGSPMRWHHLATRIHNTGDYLVHLAGQTVWGGRVDDAAAGVAWDWVQLPRGIVAMVDPMAVVTNLHLVGPSGESLSAMEAVRHINSLVRSLPWQHEVERALYRGGSVRAA
jgi:hypothetical protein